MHSSKHLMKLSQLKLEVKFLMIKGCMMLYKLLLQS